MSHARYLRGPRSAAPIPMLTRREVHVCCPTCGDQLTMIRHTGMSSNRGISFDAVCWTCSDGVGQPGKHWPYLRWHPTAWAATGDLLTIADLFPPPACGDLAITPRCADCVQPIVFVSEFFWHPATGPLHRACLALAAPRLVARAQAGELPWSMVEELGVAC